MLAASSAEAHRNHGGGEAKQGFDVLHTEDVVGGIKKTGGDLLRKCGGSGLGIAVPGTNVGAADGNENPLTHSQGGRRIGMKSSI